MFYFVSLTKESTNFPTAKHINVSVTFLIKVLPCYRYP